jgi:uncharacterized membrane protein
MNPALTMPQNPTESPALVAAFARKSSLFQRPAFYWIAGLSLALTFVVFMRYRAAEYNRQLAAAAEVLRLQYEIDKIEAREAAAQAKLREAILRGEVTYGMTEYQVIQAKGHPDNHEIGSGVFPGYRDKGAVQMWQYDDQMILFGVDNRVMGFTKGDMVYWLPQPGAKQQSTK